LYNRHMNKANLKERFWKKVYLKAETKFRSEYLHRAGGDIKCPSCQTWFSISGIKYEHNLLPYNEELEYSPCKCGQCGHTSNWN